MEEKRLKSSHQGVLGDVAIEDVHSVDAEIDELCLSSWSYVLDACEDLTSEEGDEGTRGATYAEAACSWRTPSQNTPLDEGR